MTIKEALYCDYDGIELLWSYAKSPTKAYLEMMLWKLNNNYPAEIDINKVEQIRSWFCSECQFTTSGENICCECGETINKRGCEVYQYVF